MLRNSLSRLNIGTFVAFALLLTSSSTMGQEKKERTMAGPWKVKSSKVDGKDNDQPLLGAWKVGAVWKFRKDGTGNMANSEVSKWVYDKNEEEFTTYGESFGITSKYFKASVKWIKDDVRLEFPLFNMNMEIVLTPDD